MILKDEEKRVLDGEGGDIAQKCMRFLVDYGEAAGAEYLADIDGTVDMHPGTKISWVSHYDITYEDIAEMAESGVRFAVPTFSSKPIHPGCIIDNWENCGTHPNCEPEYHHSCLSRLAPLIKMGMTPTFSCASYLSAGFLPTAGQHCAWVESSAIPWANAVLGARCNHDGSFQAAFLGKIPAYDMHLDRNRRASVLVRCETPLTRDMDYDLFGFAAGEALGLKVPVFLGIGRPTTTQLMKMNAALNTSGQVRMYHVPGLTPDAPTLEAATRGGMEGEITITKSELRRSYELLNCANDPHVDFVSLGCPHYSVWEVQRIARLLEYKKCRAALWVMTSPAVYRLAERMGLDKVIAGAGGRLLSGACPGVLGGEMPECSVIATDASKQGYYITGHVYPKKLQVWYGSMEECVDAALTGLWRGEFS